MRNIHKKSEESAFYSCESYRRSSILSQLLLEDLRSKIPEALALAKCRFFSCFVYVILFSVLCSCNLFGLPSQEGLKKLLEGNKRYISNTLEHPNRSLERREATSLAQKPFATILGCADSRVSPEILFDQGIGDLFIVRVAGNCLGTLEKESILYSALILNTSLIVVLGHEKCGAISAVYEGKASALPSLVAHIYPAIKKSPTLHEAILQNVRYVRAQIQSLPEIAPLIQKGSLQVVGGIYNMQTGAVTFLQG